MSEEINKEFEKWFIQDCDEKEIEVCLRKNKYGDYTLMKAYTDHQAFVAGYLVARCKICEKIH